MRYCQSDNFRHDLLGVKKDAGGLTIKRAYRRLATEWHPDRWPTCARRTSSRSLRSSTEVLELGDAQELRLPARPPDGVPDALPAVRRREHVRAEDRREDGDHPRRYRRRRPPPLLPQDAARRHRQDRDAAPGHAAAAAPADVGQPRSASRPRRSRAPRGRRAAAPSRRRRRRRSTGTKKLRTPRRSCSSSSRRRSLCRRRRRRRTTRRGCSSRCRSTSATPSLQRLEAFVRIRIQKSEYTDADKSSASRAAHSSAPTRSRR